METELSEIRRKYIGVFKSYYVVWKPKNPLITAIGLFRFKSYYVVWKLLQQMRKDKKQARLNRTMQYGNGWEILRKINDIGV